ncbi:coadhesin-like [Rhopilema esculentum]|uniref:coadhesin-like n=1 Tax=Rhopilema esculentum TaxID=499914 RepID=UPI0031CF15FA
MKKCIGVDYKPCNDSSQTECVGGQLGNYIYHLEERVVKAADLPIINGGYSLWSSWSECSKTCGGGTRLRNRACKEPEPLNGGQDCTELGPSDETQLCNLNPCKKSCRKAIDLGIIMDASSSVRRRNYLKMKLFIRALADDFGVSPSGTHFGILHYSSYARLDFRPNDARYHNIARLKAKINSIVYSYGKVILCRTVIPMFSVSNASFYVYAIIII